MARKKIYKAEAFDIMQYFYGTVHDPLIHCLIRFSAHLDEIALKKAVTLSGEVNPLIRCCFDIDQRRPCWKDHGFTGEDIVHVIEADQNAESLKMNALASSINILHEPQLKIYLIREKNFDTLCVIINHMVCDGAGLKEYLYVLSDIYTMCKRNDDSVPNLKFISRNTRCLFEGLCFTEKIEILFSKYDLSNQKNQIPYNMIGDRNNPFFVTLKITKQEFLLIKNYARKLEVTVNDMVLTTYARVLSKEMKRERIIIPCPVDLRRYIRSNKKHSISNFTSNFICDINITESDSFQDTLIQVSQQMKLQKLSKNCLKAVVMIEIISRLLSFNIFGKIFNKIFTMPVVSYTNLGIIDKKLLNFDQIEIIDMYITGAIKYVPYFQIAISTYDDSCTLSSNLHGTESDKVKIKHFLMEVKKELFSII